jgi:hypothetical protein
MSAILLRRLLEALSGLVKAPAVIRTPEAFFFGDAQGQMSSAVGADAIDQAESPITIAIKNEVFAQKPDGLHRILVQFSGRGDRVPISAKEFAARGARANLG